MELEETTVGSVSIVIVRGIMTLYTVHPLKERVGALAAAGVTKLVVDLSGVEQMDSSAIGALISCRNVLKKNKGDLIIATTSGVVLKLFQLTRLSTILTFFESREEAVAALEA